MIEWTCLQKVLKTPTYGQNLKAPTSSHMRELVILLVVRTLLSILEKQDEMKIQRKTDILQIFVTDAGKYITLMGINHLSVLVWLCLPNLSHRWHNSQVFELVQENRRCKSKGKHSSCVLISWSWTKCKEKNSSCLLNSQINIYNKT